MRDSQATNNAAKRSRVRQASLAGIVAMAGFVGVPALTSASPNHPFAVGKVTVVGTNTFTIVDRKGVTTVVNVTPGTTTYLERGVTAPSFANIGIGDLVAVQGTLNSGAVAATSVAIEVLPVAVGKVTVVGTNTFSIVDRKGVTTVVNVTPGTTTYLERGVTAPSFANIALGDEIAVQGTLSAGIASATAIMIEVPPVVGIPLPEVHGAPLPGIQYGSSVTTTSLPGGAFGNGIHGGFGDGLQNRHANR